MGLSLSAVMLALFGSGLVVTMVEGGAILPRGFATQSEARPKILKGRISRDELLGQYPAFREGLRHYNPEPAAVEGLQRIDKTTEILVFLGTWCPDSISEVPNFIKVYDEVANPNFHLDLIGVDRDLQDDQGLSSQMGVQRVPTYVFLQGGQELGRVVEFPNRTIEQDALHFMSEV